MTAKDTGTPPKYNPEVVGQAVLLEIIDHHPLRLTVDELVGRIAADTGDRGEVDIATEAVRELRRVGLVRYRDDDRVIEPTQTALRAHALFSAL